MKGSGQKITSYWRCLILGFDFWVGGVTDPKALDFVLVFYQLIVKN